MFLVPSTGLNVPGAVSDFPDFKSKLPATLLFPMTALPRASNCGSGMAAESARKLGVPAPRPIGSL